MTGAIGRRKGSQFRVATAVAALDLHGCEMVATLNQQLQVTVGAGKVDIRNHGGTLAAAPGQRVLVRDRLSPPLVVGTLVPYPVLPEGR
jgi:ferric-dicitrate binding protein FerR (iron transport regulator)